MESRKGTLLIKTKEERDKSLTPHNLSKILVVDDEVDLLSAYKEALERAKHQVVTAEDGEKCLEIYRKEIQREQSKPEDLIDGSPFDVVVLDYKMPRKNGLDAAEEILELNPHQRIIFASGYVEGTIADSIKQLGKIVSVLKKPFSLMTLIDLIEDKEIYTQLEKLNVSVRNLKNANPTHEQVQTYLEALITLQGGKIN